MWKLSKEFGFKNQTVKYDITGEGQPLVLVHGTPWSSFVWRNLIPVLSKSWQVHYYDLLGYGESEKSDNQDVSLSVQNELLAALLNYWGLELPIIIGHDFGGTTVLRTHLLDKKDFQKIILIDPVAVAPWGSEFFAHVNKYEAVFADIPNYIHEAMVAAYVKGAMFTDMDEETLQGIINPWLGDIGRKAFYRQIAQASQKFTDEVQPLYGQIRCPVKLIWGEEDTWIPIEQGRELHNLIGHSEFKAIPNAGHLVQEDALDLLLPSILDFI